MAKSNRILALDIGSAGIKAAEFELGSESVPVLQSFAFAEYGDELTEDTRELLVSTTLEQLLRENRFTAKNAYLSISGQFTLTRFVKLPPVSEEESRVRQIVEFEARQNVPFPMDEVIWDYQLIANPEAEELEVMFVVVKNEIVDEITRAVQAAGIFPLIVDVAPAACYNAARANGIGEEECALVLDIGGRSSNLLFLERKQFFTRTIPIAGITITQQVAKELDITLEEAEDIKRKHGFVGLGGAYEDPDSEVAAVVSKIVRNVMTRLHGEVNRSIGVYRSQQKGSRPSKLYLTGGTSILGYTSEFFTEKLKIKTQYLNPFPIVRLAPGIDTDQLESAAHIFSQVVGLALRQRSACPIEVNLLPERITRQVALRQKKPYLVGCILCVLMVLAGYLSAIIYKEKLFDQNLDQLKTQKEHLETKQKSLMAAERNSAAAQNEYDELRQLVVKRERWIDLMREVEELRPANLWVVEITPVLETEDPTRRITSRRGGISRGMPAPPPMAIDPTMRRRSGPVQETSEEVVVIEPDEGPTGEIIGLTIRGHSLSIPEKHTPDHDSVETAPETETAQATSEKAVQDNPDTPPEKSVIPGLEPEPVVLIENEVSGPEQIYLKALKNSKFFKHTSDFDDYATSKDVLNLRSFTIRLELEDKIELDYK